MISTGKFWAKCYYLVLVRHGMCCAAVARSSSGGGAGERGIKLNGADRMDSPAEPMRTRHAIIVWTAPPAETAADPGSADDPVDGDFAAAGD